MKKTAKAKRTQVKREIGPPREGGMTDAEGKMKPTKFNCGQDEHCQKKARATGEQTFTLRAQDRCAARLVCLWIVENIETAPPDKLRHALEDAIRMRIWPNRKAAD